MPTFAIQPTLKNTQAVGAALLHQFARERFVEAGLNQELIHQAENLEDIDRITAELVPDDNNTTQTNNSVLNTTEESSFGDTSTTNGIDNTVYHSMDAGKTNSSLDRMQSLPVMASYGRELRKIAEEFARSRERQKLKERANQVKLTDINKETFMVLLQELFEGGITREKIVTLFFYCTDVAIRAASFAQELVVQLLGWSFSYIINTVCRLVYELGGWDDVLFRQLPLLLINCCAILGVCILGVYLHRSLKANY